MNTPFWPQTNTRNERVHHTIHKWTNDYKIDLKRVQKNKSFIRGRRPLKWEFLRIFFWQFFCMKIFTLSKFHRHKHEKAKLLTLDHMGTPFKNEKNKTSTTPSCSGPIPAQKIGVVFSHTKPKMDFHYSHCFSWEKHTKLIYHMPWLHQYSPLLGTYKKLSKILTNYLHWILEVLKWNVLISII